MGWVLTIIVGGILGWLASKVMRTDAQQGIFLNIVVGIVGAALAGFVLSPLLGIPTINSVNFAISSLLISFLGALVLLAIVNLVRRGRVRGRERLQRPGRAAVHRWRPPHPLYPVARRRPSGLPSPTGRRLFAF